jgi:hypothetical protein
MRYEIESNNTVLIYADTQIEPIIIQPHYPNGDAFLTREDAEAWAEAKIAEFDDIDAPMAPNFKGETPQAQSRKILQEKEEARLAGIAKLVALGLTESEAKAIAYGM